LKLHLTIPQKLFLTGFAFSIAIAGFMLKLPAVFRHYDKQLHCLFYFLAAAFLNILFAQRQLLPHLLIFILLFAMGVCIEWAQEYSNKFFSRKIHGRFDKEDVLWNIKGLVGFSVVWVVYCGVWLATRRKVIG
jgi:uncharacterized membrane protein YccF (DUF307 family)